MHGPETLERAGAAGPPMRGRGGWQLFARLLIWAVRHSGKPA